MGQVSSCDRPAKKDEPKESIATVPQPKSSIPNIASKQFQQSEVQQLIRNGILTEEKESPKEFNTELFYCCWYWIVGLRWRSLLDWNKDFYGRIF